MSLFSVFSVRINVTRCKYANLVPHQDRKSMSFFPCFSVHNIRSTTVQVDYDVYSTGTDCDQERAGGDPFSFVIIRVMLRRNPRAFCTTFMWKSMTDLPNKREVNCVVVSQKKARHLIVLMYQG